MTWMLPDDIETPALVVDYDTMLANIEAMASRLADRRVALRPHAKTHKCPEIAELQVSRGAVGLTVATIGEAELFADHDFADLFIAYPVFAAGRKAARLRALAERTRLRIGVDSVPAAEALATALRGAPAGVVIEIDSGQHRSGVLPSIVVSRAESCRQLGLQVAGVFTHGGHSYAATDAPAGAAHDETDALGRAAALLADAGFDVTVVSAGSTPTALASAAGAVTEERPGTYVFNDSQQVGLGSAEPEEVAIGVATTVVSTSVAGHAIIDAGSKALSSDRPAWLTSYGVVPELADAPVVSLSEHHGIVALGDGEVPAIGSVVRVIPNHACSVVNLFDEYLVAQGGLLVGTWAVAGRGHLS